MANLTLTTTSLVLGAKSEYMFGPGVDNREQVKAAQMWFEDMGITGSHNFVQV
jgi:hypothetical protein